AGLCNDHVVASTTEDRVIASSAADHVITGITEDPVAAGFAVNQVRVCTPEGRVVARSREDDVTPVAGVNEVRAFAAQDRIGFSGTYAQFITGKRHHVVLACGSEQDVRLGRTDLWCRSAVRRRWRGGWRNNFVRHRLLARPWLFARIDLRSLARSGVGDAVNTVGHGGDT